MTLLRHVVIVGGGSAGWLTAGVLAADHRTRAADGLKVTLIESPDVPTVGVAVTRATSKAHCSLDGETEPQPTLTSTHSMHLQARTMSIW